MIEDNSIFDSKVYESNLEKSINNITFNTNIESILKDYDYGHNHFFCNKCYKFPFIKFCKDRKNVRFTCSCFNDKKILIEKLFKNFSIEDRLSRFFTTTTTNKNINIENELMCKMHKKKFKGFSKFF